MKDITYAAPRTLAETTAFLNDKGDRARILAGGTDVIVQVREGRRDIDALVDIKRVHQGRQQSASTTPFPQRRNARSAA